MRSTPQLFLGTALILASCLTTVTARADITKCIDQAGRISYSDGSCGDAVLVGYLDVTVPDTKANPAPAVVTPVRSFMALDNVPLRETAWATMPVAPHRVSTDAATIREARDALAASDRGLAALRTQKVALNR